MDRLLSAFGLFQCFWYGAPPNLHKPIELPRQLEERFLPRYLVAPLYVTKRASVSAHELHGLNIYRVDRSSCVEIDVANPLAGDVDASIHELLGLAVDKEATCKLSRCEIDNHRLERKLYMNTKGDLRVLR